MSELTSMNKALMRRIYEEMWNKGNPAYAAEIFMHPEGVEKFVRQFLQSFPDLQHAVNDMIAEEDQIAVRFSTQGTHSGAWMDFEATGKSISYTGVTWARIAAGKIVEHHTWWDRGGLIEQIKG
jgi:Predicted ester cyclase